MNKELTLEELALKCPITFEDAKTLIRNNGDTVDDVVDWLVDIQFIYARKVIAKRLENSNNKC